MKTPFRLSLIFSRGLALLFWMAVIFFFSSLPGSEIQYEPTLTYYLERKGAHVIEYAVLMWLVARFIRVLFPSQNLAKVLFWAALFSVLYGISDEFHQSFVPYRGARVSDVLIDGVGVILAGAFIFLTSRICQSYRK